MSKLTLNQALAVKFLPRLFVGGITSFLLEVGYFSKFLETSVPHEYL